MEKKNLDIQIKGHAGLFFWMQRVAEEHINKAIDLIKKAETFHWQSINFESMCDEVKEKVIKEVVLDMIDLGWYKEVDNLSKSNNKKEARHSSHR